MTKQIEAETLREWLEAQQPVTVLDIRTDEDRAQWAIPGSVHVNAYEALRAGQPGALADAAFPPDRPVVTVCNAGRVSQTAAEMLADRGFDARSLAGGMKAWSLAWNAAEVPLSDPSVRVIQVRRTGKGCLSYIVGSAGEAAVIDPSVSPDVYLELARRHGWSIRYVLETHVHADHLSRARELARQTGATLLLPPQQRVRFAFTPIADGERVPLGNASITAMHTPGHTNESTSYVLNEAAVFTGDTLFTNGVGRPDLHADPEAARQRARALFASLTRLRALPPHTVVLPAHTSEPIAFDGRARRRAAGRRRDVAVRMARVRVGVRGAGHLAPAADAAELRPHRRSERGGRVSDQRSDRSRGGRQPMRRPLIGARKTAPANVTVPSNERSSLVWCCQGWHGDCESLAGTGRLQGRPRDVQDCQTVQPPDPEASSHSRVHGSRGRIVRRCTGMLVGAGLGAVDGLSAWFSPDAQPMILAIVVGSTVKGLVTGLLAGLIARWRQSTVLGVACGLGIGFVLSSVAALGQTGHYLEIVLPGMIVGALVGFVTQRYPQASASDRRVGAAVLVALAVSALASAPQGSQATLTPDPFAPLALLVGRWVGTTEGQPGKDTVEREYSRALGSRFIRVTNRSTYPPQSANPKGETHEDEGWFSYDRARKRLVLRQFHVEGLNQYVEDSTPLRFVSEAIENIPAGWRARETYVLDGPDELEEVFELAEPGKEFERYSRSRLTRAR